MWKGCGEFKALHRLWDEGPKSALALPELRIAKVKSALALLELRIAKARSTWRNTS